MWPIQNGKMVIIRLWYPSNKLTSEVIFFPAPEFERVISAEKSQRKWIEIQNLLKCIRTTSPNTRNIVWF